MRTACLALVWPLLCAASDRPAELEALADLARGAPPEFAAEALLRIGSLDKLDKRWRVELLEEAFNRAAGAQQPFRVHPADFPTNGQAGFLERAYSQELDILSLRTRAIDAMLPLDAGRARRLFGEIPPPRLPDQKCKDSLVPEVAPYYVTLGKVLAGAFTAKEVQEEENFKFLQRSVALNSPAQVGPIAHLLAEARLTDAQFQSAAASYVAALAELRGDDRAFHQARAAGARIKELVDAMRKRQVSPVPLVQTYRDYLARHLATQRCEDSARIGVKIVIESWETGLAESQAASDPGRYFNDVIRIDPVPALSIQEQTPFKLEGEAEGLKVCDSPECTEVAKRVQSLALKPDKTAWSPAEKETAEWRSQLQEVLSAMADWKQDTGFSVGEHFRFKSSVYSDLLAVVPPGASRDTVLRASHDFLRSSRLQAPSRAEWFLPVAVLIGRVAVDPLGLGRFGQELEGSADPVIALFARLEKAAPRPTNRVVALF